LRAELACWQGEPASGDEPAEPELLCGEQDVRRPR
jgi:hypothetical protein